MRNKLLSLFGERFIKNGFLLIAALVFGVCSWGQTTHTLDFENLTINPYGNGSINDDQSATWTIVDAGINSTNTHSGTKALTFDDEIADDHYITSPEIANGINTVSVWYRHWDGDSNTLTYKLYTSPDGTTWTYEIDVCTNFNSTTWTQFSHTINDASVKYIKMVNESTKKERLIIDDFVLTDIAATNGPTITNISNSPLFPTSSDAVSISADITDTDGINGAEVHWGTSIGSLTNTISMSVSSGDTYITDTDIPSQSNGTTVYYEIYAIDNNTDETTSSEESYNVFDPPTTTIPYSQLFTADLDDCSIYSASGATKEWIYSSGTAQMNGYNSGDIEEDWLIIPGINFDNYSNEEMTFNSEWQYGTDDADNYLKLVYSTDYIGVGDPTSSTWTELSFTHPASATTQTTSGTIDLSGISGTNVYIAFKYRYESGSYRKWEIDDISIIEGVAPNAPDWCNLQSPASGTITSGGDFNVYAQIWEDGVTNTGSPGAGITAWIGYNTTNSDPETWDEADWHIANFNTDVSNNDEFMANIGNSLSSGTYYYASRFSVDGINYKYGGYNAGGGNFWDGTNNVSGVLTVNANYADFCNIQSPASGSISVGGNFDVYAQVYEPSVTEAGGQGAGISAWIGYNTTNSVPSTWDESDWHEANYNTDIGNNDEYMLEIGSSLPEGTYYYASRFRVDPNNEVYSYGGLGGVWGGGNISGVLTITDNTAPTVTTFNPADNETDVAIDSDLVITFDETVQAGTGNIVIKEVSGGATFQTIAIGSTTISGNTVTISHNDFDYSTAYYVEIASGVITDAATTPNNYAGISGSSAWNFTTEAVPAVPSVFISEISAKGYGGSSTQEYIELTNTGGSSQDLTGWKIEYYNNSSLETTTTLSGSVSANSAFLIAKSGSGDINGVTPDNYLHSSTFMNTTQHVILKDATNTIVDQAGGPADKFANDINYEFTACGTDNLPVSSWINLGTGNGTPGVVNCVVTNQEINIQASATNYLTGSTYDFGDVENGSSSSVITFTIQNTGTLDLNLTGTPKIVISGTNQADFTVNETSTTTPVTASGTTTFTIQFTPSALGSRTASISIANNDSDENPYTINLTGNCTAPDLTDPTVTTLSPLDNATDVDIATNLVITFDENIDAGTGNIEIRRTSDDGLVESFDVTSDISISGNEVTINPSSDLSYSTEYYVLIDATAIVDLASTPNSYDGISSTTDWSFTTMDVPAVPEAITPCREALDGYPDWTDTDATGTTTIYMIDGTSSLISPAMNFDLHTGETISLDADKYGGATDAEAVITVSVSEDNGSTWAVAGTFNPTTTTLDPQTPIDLSAYSGTQVKVKLETLAANNSDGVIVDNICIMGSVICSTPTVQASNISFSNISAYSMQIDWTNGDGLKRAVFVKEGSGAITNPTDGVTYTASSNWSSKGTQLGTSGYYCVYNGSGTSVTLTNLDDNTEYYVQVFEYGCSTGAQQYLNSTNPTNPNNETTLVANPTIVVNPASISGLDYNVGSGPSVAQSFNISGTDLTAGPITITAPANFLVCSTEDGTYVSSYTIPYTSPTLASTTVYVKLAGGLSVNTYLGNVTCAGGNATTQNVSVRGDVLAAPLITITGSDISLNAICNSEGIYSIVQSFDLEGSNLSANLTVGFSFTSSKIELSSDNTTWYSATTTTLSFTPVANSVSETIYVRSVGGVGTTAGSTATVQCKSTSATTQTLDIDYVINGLPIIGSPSDITVAEGNPASFSIFDPTGLTFQWQQSEPFPSTNWVDLIGETSNSLTLSTVSAEMDQYKYRIYATNANGCTDTSSFSGVLTVTSTGLINSCGTQNFTSGTTPPSGWTFTNINTTNGSALEMDATNDRIISAPVTAPTLMSFWLQGLGTMTGSSLLVEGFNGFSWNTIENITSIPTVATTKTYTVAGNSIDNYSKFRFTFTKGTSSANLAFDDVVITCGTESDAWLLNESFDNVTSIADINNNLTDVSGFTASETGGGIIEAGSISARYNRGSSSLKMVGAVGSTITLTTPDFGGGADLLTFYYSYPGNGDLEVYTSTTAKASWTLIETIGSSPSYGRIYFIPITTDVVKVQFRYTRGTTGYAFLDDIRIRDASKGGNYHNDLKILQTLIQSCSGGEGINESVTFKTGANPVKVENLSVSFPNTGEGGNEYSMDSDQKFTTNPTYIDNLNDLVEVTNPGCRPVSAPPSGIIPANSLAVIFTGRNPSVIYDFKAACPSTTYYVIFCDNTNTVGRYGNDPDPGDLAYTTIIDKSTGSYDTKYYDENVPNVAGALAEYDESTGAMTYKANDCEIILDVDLISFEANCQDYYVYLEWKTATETNNDYFTIEKSSDLNKWEVIGIIEGNGNSNRIRTYNLVDDQLSDEVVYYRLKQTDYDGIYNYFNPIAVNCNNDKYEFFTLYPNPTSSEITCEFYNSNDRTITFEVMNALGQVFYQNKSEMVKGINILEIDLSELANGIYYFKMYSDNGKITKTRKIIKQ